MIFYKHQPHWSPQPAVPLCDTCLKIILVTSILFLRLIPVVKNKPPQLNYYTEMPADLSVKRVNFSDFFFPVKPIDVFYLLYRSFTIHPFAVNTRPLVFMRFFFALF